MGAGDGGKEREAEKIEREVEEKVEKVEEKGEEMEEKAEGVFEGVRRSGEDVYKAATAIPSDTVTKVREWAGFNSTPAPSGSDVKPAKDDKPAAGGKEGESESGDAGRNEDDVNAVRALPIVVLKNYNAGKRDDVLDVLGQWAAGLVDNQVRFHVPFSKAEG